MLKRVLRQFSKNQRIRNLITLEKEDKPESKDLMISQHPKNFNDKDPYLINPNMRYEYLTPRNQIDFNLAASKHMDLVEPGEGRRYIEVSIIGAPNAGKSSLINKIQNQKINAVSGKTHTTNENCINVKTFENEGIQIALWDTPGFVARHKNSTYQTKEAWKAVNTSDMVSDLIL